MIASLSGNNSQINLTEVILRELDPNDNVGGFKLGSPDFVPLKTFLQKHAKSYHSKNVTKTYVLVTRTDNKVWGYVSLVCSQIQLLPENSPDDIDGYKYSEYPSIKIVRLAVDARIKDRDLGTKLVSWSISIAKNKIMPAVGCRFLVVDSKPSAIRFYEKSGFTLLDTEANKESPHPLLFIDLHKVES